MEDTSGTICALSKCNPFILETHIHIFIVIPLILWFSAAEEMASCLTIELSVVGFIHTLRYSDVAETIERRPQWNAPLAMALGYGFTPLPASLSI